MKEYFDLPIFKIVYTENGEPENRDSFVHKIKTGRNRFDDKKIDGVHRLYSFDGKFKGEETWLSEELVKNTVYYDSGQKKREYTAAYSDDGIYIEKQEFWYSNGQLESVGSWRDYKSEGLFQTWYENGQLKSEESFSDGEVIDVLREYGQDGTLFNGVEEVKFQDMLISIKPYKEGVIHGVVESYFKNGDLKRQESYKDGVQDGEYKWWFENGALKEEGAYKDGRLHGCKRHWYENGQMECEEMYEDGLRVGVFRYWSKQGRLEMRETYEEDVLIKGEML